MNSKETIARLALLGFRVWGYRPNDPLYRPNDPLYRPTRWIARSWGPGTFGLVWAKGFDTGWIHIQLGGRDGFELMPLVVLEESPELTERDFEILEAM